MNPEFWYWVGQFILYFVGIFGGMVVVAFLYFFVKELLFPSPAKGTHASTTPDNDGVRLDDGELDSEIGRSATQLAEHRKAASQPRKEQRRG